MQNECSPAPGGLKGGELYPRPARGRLRVERRVHNAPRARARGPALEKAPPPRARARALVEGLAHAQEPRLPTGNVPPEEERGAGQRRGRGHSPADRAPHHRAPAPVALEARFDGRRRRGGRRRGRRRRGRRRRRGGRLGAILTLSAGTRGVSRIEDTRPVLFRVVVFVAILYHRKAGTPVLR